jgi:hypothetical protein
LSLERAREYDRVSEVLGTRKVSVRDLNPHAGVEFGVEARRAQFDKNSYRQPVLTQDAMVPRSYRQGQVDTLTDNCQTRLRELKGYALMQDIASHSDSNGPGRGSSADNVSDSNTSKSMDA